MSSNNLPSTQKTAKYRYLMSEISSTTPSELEVDNPTFFDISLEPDFTVGDGALVSGVEAGDGVEDVTFKPSSCCGSRRP